MSNKHGMPNRRMSILRKFKNARATFSRFLKPEWNNPNIGDNRRALQMKQSPPDGIVSTEAGRELLPGEQVLCECADAVREQVYATDSDSHFKGRLILTNFRLLFIPDENSANKQQHHRDLSQRSRIVGNDDIVLNCIDTVYKVSSKKQKKKKLMIGSSLVSKTRRFEIHCKDFRLHRFTFLEATSSEAITALLDTLLSCAFPHHQQNLFAFVHAAQISASNNASDTCLPQFNSSEDWTVLLNGCNARGYRVAQCNTGFNLCDSLPESFVVPRTMSDKDVLNAVRCSVNNRCPVWTYSHSNGAAIVRAGCPLPGLTTDLLSQIQSHISNSSQANDSNRRLSSHSQASLGSPPPTDGSQPPSLPVVIDLDAHMMSLIEVRTAHEALRQICMPASLKEFWTSDATWFASLEASDWLNIISRCLMVANQAASYICYQSRSVILKEESSCDWSALIASLMQLLLDERYRTAEGYQRLIDKDWVALGHRFTDRYCLEDVRTTEQCPLFLLFLDCSYQLLHLFPSSFQFTEIYLVSIWDSLGLGMFRNFLYNNIRSAIYPPHRQGNAEMGGKGVYHKSKPAPLPLKSVWDWGDQFEDDQISLFYNPLYLLLHGDGPGDSPSSPDFPTITNTATAAGNSNANNSSGIEIAISPVGDTADAMADKALVDARVLGTASMTASLHSDLTLDENDTGVRRRGNRFTADLSPGRISSTSSLVFSSPLSPASRSILHDAGSPTLPQTSPKAGFIKADLFDSFAAAQGDKRLAGILRPHYGAASLRLWSLCYLRWLPPAEIVNGGEASQYLVQCITVEEILHLQHKISVMESLVAGRSHRRGGQARSRPRSILVFGSVAEGVSQGSLGNQSLSGSLFDTSCAGDDVCDSSLQSSESQAGRGAVQGRVITSSFPFPLEYSSGSGPKCYSSSYMDEFFRSSILCSDTSMSQIGGVSSLEGGACLDEEAVFDDEGGVEYRPGDGANGYTDQ